MPVDALAAKVDTIAVSQNSGLIAYATKADMDADLSKPDGSLAQVTNDPTTANNQSYRKSGASGSGSWVASVDRVAAASQFTSAGTGAVVRSTQAKASERLTLFDFIEPQDHASIIAGTSSNEYSAQVANAITQAVNGKVVCHVNGGTYTLASAIGVVPGLALKGEGRNKSVFSLANGANCPLITNKSGSVNADYLSIEDLQFYGNSANQTDDSVNLVDLYSPTSASPRIHVKNVFVQKAKGNGFVVRGFGRDSMCDGITVYFCDGFGFKAQTADSHWSNINVGQSLKTGFLIGAGGLYTNIKAWYSGRLDPANTGSNAFQISADAVQGHNLWAQDTTGHGFYISGSNKCILSMVSQNSGDHGAYLTGSSDNIVELQCIDDVGAVNTHNRAIGHYGSSARNEARVKNTTSAVSINTGGDENLNQTRILREPALAKAYAFTYSFSAQVAEVFKTTLTGNVSVQAPSAPVKGLEVELQFTQDATGGRTVTFDGVFKVNWTPATTAGKLNIIRFRYDGMNWLQIAASVGL